MIDACAILEKALEETGLAWAEEKYCGTAKKYVVYIEELQDEFSYADNLPVDDITYFQIHYFCPLFPKDKEDSKEAVRKIKKILRRYGFSFNGGTQRRREEEKWRHAVFHCNILTSNEERKD
ncbi:MAG: hypothetical protein HDQ97_19210 [Lachnospiraceae bacterium]|nr:hypothetical protein [Lachnospiraceae bacterium]